MNYYDGLRKYLLQISGYSIKQLVEKYNRDAKKCISKYYELDELSGDSDVYILYGFWDKQILPSDLKAMGKYTFNEKNERERLNNALFHFHKIGTELDRYIKERKEWMR